MSQDSAAAETIYHPIQKLLHWVVALLVVIQIGIAWTMPDIGPQTKLGRLISLHLTLGAVIAFVGVARVCWRLCRRGPGAGMTEARLLRAAARVTHGTVYVLLLVVPLLGWAAASARGWRVAFFDHRALPALLPHGSAAGFLAGDAHAFLAYLLLALLVFHVSAALYHRFILHDEVLARMLPNARRPPWVSR
jgi:cytochrome b561